MPRAATAQAQRLTQIGYLGPTTIPAYKDFRDGLTELGWVEGVTMRFHSRWAPGQDREHLDPLARELVSLGVDLIATLGTPATAAAIAATQRIPIVMVAVGDPVGSGFVQSLSRPGGNVTGVSVFTVDLPAKQLQLLREIVANLRQLAVLWDRGNPGAPILIENLQRAAKAQGVSVTLLPASRPEELEPALNSLGSRPFDALFVHEDAMFNAERRKIVELVSRAHVPALYGGGAFADAGGLMSYGVEVPDTIRRAAVMIDKVLKGAKPAELPVEEPRRFEFVVNLKTAKALGVTIPRSLLLRADRVIE